MDTTNDQALHTWVTTCWLGVFEGCGAGGEAEGARRELLLRYHEAVYRYFLLKLHNPDAAAELYSNFAERLLESDVLLRRVDPRRGRFRNYLRTTLYHMVADYYGTKKDEAHPDLDRFEPVVPPKPDEEFDACWRQALLNQAWKGLEERERANGNRHYTVLRCASEHPGARSPQLAELLAVPLGKVLTPEAARKALQRAREEFSELLVAEVGRSLEGATLDQVEEELAQLQLLVYCEGVLKKRRAGVTPKG
jgi:RNA polymerase sigma factor (sigma-70 family)